MKSEKQKHVNSIIQITKIKKKLLLLFIFGASMFVTINPGQKGVLFEKLGDGLEKDYEDESI